MPKPSLHNEIIRRLDKIDTNLEDHMARTSALEKFQAKWAGAFMTLTALATLAGIVAAVFKVAEAFH